MCEKSGNKLKCNEMEETTATPSNIPSAAALLYRRHRYLTLKQTVETSASQEGKSNEEAKADDQIVVEKTQE